jgi:hypothetical protein
MIEVDKMKKYILMLMVALCLVGEAFAAKAKSNFGFDVDDGVNIEGINRTTETFKLEVWKNVARVIPTQSDELAAVPGGKSFHLVSFPITEEDLIVPYPDYRLIVMNLEGHEVCRESLKIGDNDNLYMVEIERAPNGGPITCEVKYQTQAGATTYQSFINKVNEPQHVQGWSMRSLGELQLIDTIVAANGNEMGDMWLPTRFRVTDKDGYFAMSVNDSICFPLGRVRGGGLIQREDICRHIRFIIEPTVMSWSYLPRRLWDGKRFWIREQ